MPRPSPSLPLLFTILLTASPAAASELRLSWDQCAADAVVSAKAFTCDTNQGNETLIGSVVVDGPDFRLVGIDSYLRIRSAGSAVPSWWQFHGSGTCRRTAVTAFPTPVTYESQCLDPYGGYGSGGLVAYQQDDGPSEARVTISFGVIPSSAQVTVPAGQEVFAFRLLIRHSLTAGVEACAGCDEPVCITFEAATLIRWGSLGNTLIQVPDPGTMHPDATGTWQGAGAASVAGAEVICPRLTYPPCRVNVACSVPTPVRPSTWGLLKSLYH